MPAQSLHFKDIPIEEVLPDVTIELMHEAPGGLLWFGSSEGLIAYNGHNFFDYLKSDTTSNHVRAMYHDRAGTFWIGYQDGTIYNFKNDRLHPWAGLQKQAVKVPITSFQEDTAGRLWISTYGSGLYMYEQDSVYHIQMKDGLLGNDIYTLCSDGQGGVWAGTDGGISIVTMPERKKIIRNLTYEEGLPDQIIREIIPDRHHNFWIGTYDGGICYYDSKSETIHTPLPDWKKGIVNNLELFDGIELWIGTENSGLWKYDLRDSTLTAVHSKAALEKAKIYDLHKDAEGNIWVASSAERLCVANRQFEWLYTDFENIQTVCVDRQNHLWLGTPQGVYRSKTDGVGDISFKNYFPDLNVISLLEDRFGNIWLGTFGQGILIYNKKIGRRRWLKVADGLTNGSILSMAAHDHKIWLATLGGVTEILLEEDLLNGNTLTSRNFDHETGLGTNFIYKVFIDSKGRTWFATDGEGITVLEAGQFKTYDQASDRNSSEPRASFNTVYSICEDSRGHIWFSTARRGIFEFDGERFYHLTLKEGIRDLAITGLATDEKGNILIIHPSGIDLLNPLTRHLIYYDTEVGIEDIDPYLNAFQNDKQNNIWIGVKNGLIKYTPLQETLEIHPRTRINKISVFSQPVDFKNKTQYAYGENYLVFEYQGLWYTDPKTVKYQYQLEGYDRDWITSRDQKVVYSNLPPGHYTFKVKSTENDAWLDEPIASYSFQIERPVWQRWWFLLGAAAMAIGLFYWYQKNRDLRIQRVNLLQKEKAESQFEALKSQINPHFLFNSFNTLSAIIEENPDMAVEYVEKLSDFYRNIIQHRDREVISLDEEIELVKNYKFLFKKRFGDNFNLKIDIPPSAAIYIVPLTLQMLVENAIKHNIVSKTKPLYVEISLGEHSDYISVKNNLQRKNHTPVSTHFGLQSIKKRYALLNGKSIEIITTQNTFEVRIPVIFNS